MAKKITEPTAVIVTSQNQVSTEKVKKPPFIDTLACLKGIGAGLGVLAVLALAAWYIIGTSINTGLDETTYSVGAGIDGWQGELAATDNLFTVAAADMERQM